MTSVADDHPTPRVSVVMPVFNGAAYLAEAVESVLAQTFPDFELVAVDDGSRDDSLAILEGFADRDSRVRLLASETNLGISATLNRGWREGRGTYIARLDADDVALPDRLARQVEFLDNHPSVAVVGGAAIIIDATGRRGAVMRLPTRSAAIRARLLQHNCLVHPSVTMRRAALEMMGGYRFDHVEDYDLWLRISERFQLANLAEPVILYRRHVDQVSLTALEEQVRRTLAVRTAARARLASHRDPLADVSELTPTVLAHLNLDRAELTRTLEHECLAWASTLAELNKHDEADELVAQASRTLGNRAVKAFAAAGELQRAEALLGEGHPLAGATHVLLAFRREPRYASSCLSAWLADRLRGRRLLG